MYFLIFLNISIYAKESYPFTFCVDLICSVAVFGSSALTWASVNAFNEAVRAEWVRLYVPVKCGE